MCLAAIKMKFILVNSIGTPHQARGGSIGGGAIGTIAPPPLAANFLNVVCEFSVKFFLFFGPYYQQICGKEGKFAVSLGRTKAKRLSASGGLTP